MTTQPAPATRITKAELRSMPAGEAHRAFSATGDEISKQRSVVRCSQRDDRIARRDDWLDTLARNPWLRDAYAEQRENELEAAYHACLPDTDVVPTKKQRRLVREDMDRQEHPDWFRPTHVNSLVVRFKDGYKFDGGTISDTYEQDTFTEIEARTKGDPFLRRFAASACTKLDGRRVVYAGFTNHSCKPRRPFRGLDMPNVRVCRSGARDIFRIETDLVWPSADALDAAVAEVAEATGIWPHARVSFADRRRPGEILRPHFWFCLREGAAVYRGDCQKALKQKKLLEAVAAALVVAFERLGSDPGGLLNLHQGKNPISPHSTYHAYRDAEWLTLAEMSERLGMRGMCSEKAARIVSAERLARAGVVPEQSQEGFTWLAETARAVARERLAAGKDWSDFGAVKTAVWALRDQCPVQSHRADWRRDRSLGQMIDNVIRFTIDTFDPKKAQANHRRRGRIAHRVRDLDIDAAQAEGGRYSASVVGNQSLLAISREMAPYVASGTVPTRQAIADACGLHRNTVGKHWASAWENAVASHALAEARKAAAAHAEAVREISLALTARPGAVKGYTLDLRSRIMTVPASAEVGQSRIRPPIPSSRSGPGQSTLRFLAVGRPRVFAPVRPVPAAA